MPAKGIFTCPILLATVLLMSVPSSRGLGIAAFNVTFDLGAASNCAADKYQCGG